MCNNWAQLRAYGMKYIDQLRFCFAGLAHHLARVQDFVDDYRATLAGFHAALGDLVTL